MDEPRKPQPLADDLYDGPLDHVIRNHPRLFVHPLRWSHHHARFLHVSCMDAPSLLSISNQDNQIKKKKHRSSVKGTDKSKTKPDSDLPEMARLHLRPRSGRRRSRVGKLSAKGPLFDHMSRVVSKKIEQSIIIAPRPTLMAAQLVEGLTPQRPTYGVFGVQTRDKKKDRVIVQGNNIPIEITYASRTLPIVPRAPMYTFGSDTPPEFRQVWRLALLNRSELEKKPTSKRRWRSQLLAYHPSINTKTSAPYEFNAGRMAALFIGMAQRRRSELKKSERLGRAAESAADVRPRYQILVWDDNRQSPCVHLYTAEVSDFLLDHFRTPARLPHTGWSKDESSHLIKIHRIVIPQRPHKSFRRRLRTAITQYANGTAGGFFPTPSQESDGDDEGKSGSESTTVKVEQDSDDE
ncbi:hypothetical protein F5Y01DRAFT_288300 [Xylaria sp. FL0043]|nr:hypothetical protein F5Y01DRAFT_288300 [Xylaria sp. FL0043]